MAKWAQDCFTPLCVQVVCSLVRLLGLMKSHTLQCSAWAATLVLRGFLAPLLLGPIPKRSSGVVLPGTRSAGSRDSWDARTAWHGSWLFEEDQERRRKRAGLDVWRSWDSADTMDHSAASRVGLAGQKDLCQLCHRPGPGSLGQPHAAGAQWMLDKRVQLHGVRNFAFSTACRWCFWLSMPSDTVLPCRDTLHSLFLGAEMGLLASGWGLEEVLHDDRSPSVSSAMETLQNLVSKTSRFVPVCSTRNLYEVTHYSCRWREVNYSFSLQYFVTCSYNPHLVL